MGAFRRFLAKPQKNGFFRLAAPALGKKRAYTANGKMLADVTQKKEATPPGGIMVVGGDRKMEPTVVYLDRYIFTMSYSWLMTAMALWVVGRMASRPLKWSRCWQGSFPALIYLVWLYLARFRVLPGRVLINNPLAWLAVGGLMVVMAWRTVRFAVWLPLYLRFLLVSAIPLGLSIGLHSVLYSLGRSGLPQWAFFAAPPAFMLILGELGWGIVHEALYEQALVPVEIDFGTTRVATDALIDTGNLLRDPLTRSPVVIIEMNLLAANLPPDVRQFVSELNSGVCPEIRDNNARYWYERLRLLPYLTVGCEHGILAGFRPDEIRFVWKGKVIRHHRVVVGFYEQDLSPHGAYRALIPPVLLETP